MTNQQTQGHLWFDQSKIGLSPEHVCWLDVMGTASTMSRSIPQSANFVMKLHAAVLSASGAKSLALFPMSDGLFVCSPSAAPLRSFLQSVFCILAEEFIKEQESLHRFLVRAAVSYGPIAKGTQLNGGSFVLGNNPGYVEKILLGPPLAAAYGSEREAAPFGIFVHESARTLAPSSTAPFYGAHWEWWGSAHKVLAGKLKESLIAHYDWCSARPDIILYPQKEQDRHRGLLEQYFVDL